MLIRKCFVFLLVFLKLFGVTFQKTRSRHCGDLEIEKDKLEINIMPINFRYSENEKNKQMLMQLSVSNKVKNCMDSNKFNLTIGLDVPILEFDNEVKVNIIASQHLVKVGKQALEIERCVDSTDNSPMSGQDLKYLQGWTNKGKNNKKIHKELIFFIAPVQLWEIQGNVKSITMSFEELSTKKRCDYDRKNKLPFKIETTSDVDDGISGPLIFSMPDWQGTGHREVHMKGRLGKLPKFRMTNNSSFNYFFSHEVISKSNFLQGSTMD